MTNCNSRNLGVWCFRLSSDGMAFRAAAGDLYLGKLETPLHISTELNQHQPSRRVIYMTTIVFQRNPPESRRKMQATRFPFQGVWFPMMSIRHPLPFKALTALLPELSVTEVWVTGGWKPNDWGHRDLEILSSWLIGSKF